MKTQIKIVIGANAGDEGKGNITNRFSTDGTIGVLTNGGPQRGHTVVLGGRRHIFSHFSSGTFAGAATYFGPEFMLNPMQFVKEYDELCGSGAAVPPVYIDSRCRFTTPYDMMLNQAVHEAAGTHHTCGMGIWETYVRYRDGGYVMPAYTLRGNMYELAAGSAMGTAVPIGVFVNMSYNQKLLYLLRIRENAVIRMRESYPEAICMKWKAIMESDNLPDHFIADTMFMCSRAGRLCGNEILLTSQQIVMENGQGLLLDWSDDELLARYTTPSRTGAKAVLDLIENTFSGADVEMCYVTRTYLTRHGDGPLEGECHPDAIATDICEKTNVTNAFQGSFRYGTMNVEALTGRIDRDYGVILKARRGLTDKGRKMLTAGADPEPDRKGELCNHYRKSLVITHADELMPSEELMEAAQSFDRHYVIASA